jgi:hypothetical protein
MTDRLATDLLKYFVISLALRHLVPSFYFLQYNGLLHDFNVITSVKWWVGVCVCVCVCVCSLRLRKLVSIGWHGNGCSVLCLDGSRGLVNLTGFQQHKDFDSGSSWTLGIYVRVWEIL